MPIKILEKDGANSVETGSGLFEAGDRLVGRCNSVFGGDASIGIWFELQHQ